MLKFIFFVVYCKIIQIALLYVNSSYFCVLILNFHNIIELILPDNISKYISQRMNNVPVFYNLQQYKNVTDIVIAQDGL